MKDDNLFLFMLILITRYACTLKLSLHKFHGHGKYVSVVTVTIALVR